ncbi:MAG: undecaprenyldiphospho-muramoylpentapeptide beta-N-acetylglucosaminyltransferase [Bacteroidetes bacterium]|nr:undecaprenyldiphospho-muramoylpentapeptide beta-N-acetylglucosaminyltransferase [Bacteroidota bacterium]
MSLQQRKIKVIISGGGTGGHIFPAIAIANELKRVNAENEILFVGAEGRMEMEKVPAAGYKIQGLKIAGIQRKLDLKNLSLPVKVIRSVMTSRSIIKNFRPDAAVGVGGYASGPLLYAASVMKIPSLIQEQNSFAGITNKILSRRVKKVCVAYEGMEKYFAADKIVMTGNPVRQDVIQTEGKKEEALQYFNLSNNKKTVLVIGGSLGARSINEAIRNGLQKFSDQDIQLIWQTGKNGSKELQEAGSSFKNCRCVEFISRMDLAYSCADVVISRAGASSVSELELTAKPCVLVPSPNVAEDHQTKNAMALVNKNAAILVRDAETGRKLVAEAIALISDNEKQKVLSQNISKLAMRNSAEKIVAEIYKMIS